MESELYNAAIVGNVSFLNDARDYKDIESGSDEYFLMQTISKNNILHLAIRRQQLEFIEVILKGLISINSIDTLLYQMNDDGSTPVHVAAEVGNMEIFKLLHDYVLYEQTIHDEGKVLWMQNAKGNMPLHVALIHGNVEVAKLLVEKHHDMVRVLNIAGETPLHLASIHQPIDVPVKEREATSSAYLGMIKSLLEKESCVACWRDARGSTPLHRAASITSAYNLQIVRLILDHCPHSAELRDGSNKTVLHLFTAISNYKEGKDLLGITEIFDLKDHQDDEGNTPLHTAAMNMNFFMVRILLDSSAKQSIRNKDGISAASLIQQQFEVIMEKEQMTKEICKAIERVDIAFLKERLHQFLFLGDSNGRNVLHKLMQINGRTVILYNEFVGFIEQVVEWFPELICQLDHNGDTPLHILMQNSRKTMIRLASVTYNYAVLSLEESNLVRELLGICCNYFNRAQEETSVKGDRYDPPWLVQNMAGNTPIHEALRAEHDVIVVRNLSQLDIVLAARLMNNLNETPLHLLAGYHLHHNADHICNSSFDGELEGIIEELATANQEAIYTCDKTGLTPLLRAAQCGNLETILSLYKYSPDAALMSDAKYGHTFWHLLVLSKDPASAYSCNYLLSNRPELIRILRLKDYEGNTPLHLAIQGRRFEIANIFLHGMDTELMNILLEKKNNADTTPSDLLRSSPEIPNELQELLENNGLVVGIRSVWDVPTSQIEQYANTMGVVAALITTITFTAAFTVPGGNIEGDKGFPALIREAAFQAFMISNILAMCLSMMVLFCLLWVIATTDKSKSVVLMDFSLLLLLLSLYATLVAFMMGVYVTTIHVKPWIAIITLVVCSILMLLMHKNLVMDCLVPVVKGGLVWFGPVINLQLKEVLRFCLIHLLCRRSTFIELDD